MDLVHGHFDHEIGRDFQQIRELNWRDELVDPVVDFVRYQVVVLFADLVVDLNVLVELAPVIPVIDPQMVVESLDCGAALDQL